jgi:YD repeat-containing protein
MKNRNQFNRIIATFFLVIFFPTLVPSSLYANTNGPTAPEATSFEPIDATDMVNLASGDFSYVLPLIDVPSPEGGYPLSLAYHAGIASDQDASWVGLGWSLNPGSINRSISGFPDDWKEGKISSVVYDSGGEITTHDFSVGVGWGDGKYSAGLYGSYSENKAFGGQNAYNFDGGLYAGVGNVKGSIGSDGVGLNYTNDYNFKLGTQSVNGNYSIGINHSFKTGGTSLSVSANSKMASTGTTTGSASETKFNGSVGISSTSYLGSNSGSHNSSYSMFSACDSFILNASVYLFRINYSYSKVRYWHFDKKSYSGVGTLYAENITNVRNNSIFQDQQGFDSYVANYDQSDSSLVGNNIALPAYDFYSVSGQGLAGDISPKIFEYGTLTPKLVNVNIQGTQYQNAYQNKNSFTRKLDSDNIHFYFNDTNESFLSIDSNLWANTPSSVGSITDFNSPSSNLVSSVTIDGTSYNGYDPTKNRKKGASHIETYTNNQIISNQNLVYTPNNFNRNTSSIPKDGIGAFKITAPDGKTYHYSIPVYQKEKFARSSQYNEDINNKFYEEYQTAPYATHWLLTAITGSDFVDDGDGSISDKDLGYWVIFDYGKWSDGYTWRTPRGGDYKATPTSKAYEWGVKEIYYLNAVKTRTHTALFIKSVRQDGKSIPDSMDREFDSFGITQDKCRYDVDTSLWYFNGIGFNSPGMTTWQVASLWTLHKARMIYNRAEHKLLKLDKIIVVKNKDIPTNFKYSNPNEAPASTKVAISISEYINIYRRDNSSVWEQDYTTVYDSAWSGEYYSNVLDNADINYYYQNIQSLSKKIIEFDHGYSLAKGTPNTVNSTEGRLTLNKITYKGKDGVQVLPPYKFGYENPTQGYNINNIDDWGYNKGLASSWNLNNITHPNGANLSIKYEEDDYYTEAVNYETVIKDGLKFIFYNYNGNLRINVQNENLANPNKINFSSFYEINKKAKINIWACHKHEYWDFGCEHRDGHVDINDEYVEVVGVNQNDVTFETTLGNHTHNYNGGLSGIYEAEFTYGMDRIQNDKKRGEYPDLSDGCSERTAYTMYYSINTNKINKDQNGGGLRVKQISVNSDGKSFNTNYYYNQNGFDKNKGESNYKSSGITSYTPSKYNKNIKYMAELPPPGVLYNTVTVETNEDINKYYFKTFSPEIENSTEYSMGDILQIKKIQSEGGIVVSVPNYTGSTLSKYKYEVKNNFSMIGKLLKQEKYNKSNQLLRKVENNYKQTSSILQGVTKETFNSYNVINHVSYPDFYNIFNLNISSKTVYPSVIESVKVTENGVANSTYYSKYDFLTGQVLETKTLTSDGKSFKTKVVPAYTKYSQMGSKADNPNNRNMLSQTAAEYSYIYDATDAIKPWKETGVGITTWNNEWSYQDIEGNISNPALDLAKDKVWRKHKTYVWNGVKDAQGIFSGYDSTTSDDGFVWGVGSPQPANSKWKQISEVTLYDHYSMALEAKDINGNKATTKMGDNDTKIIATGNAGYNEMYYTGAENLKTIVTINWLEPKVSMKNATRNPSYFHTGKQSVATTSTGEFGILLLNGQQRWGKYKLSVWVEKTNATKAALKINGAIVPFINDNIVAGNWILKTALIDVPQTIPTAGYSIYLTSADATTVYYDDFMLRPVASAITGYVYNEFDELTHIIGNNGLSTRFEYDAAGRLSKTYVEVVDDAANGLTGGFKLQSDHQIFYKKQN